MVASLNLILQNRGRLVQIIKQNTQIGGYRSQGEDAEERTELASVEGLQLAVSLDLEGTDAIRGLLSSTQSERSQKGPSLVDRRGARPPPTTHDMPRVDRAPEAVQKHMSSESGDSRRSVPPRMVSLAGQTEARRTENASASRDNPTAPLGHTTHIINESDRESESVSRTGKEKSSDNTPQLATNGSPTDAVYQPAAPNCKNPRITSKPKWNNEGDSVDNYISPPVIDWTDSRVNEEFLKEPFCKLDLTKSCIGSAEILQLKRLII